MVPYPVVTSLPPIIDTRGWRWKPFIGPRPHNFANFFVGTDTLGDQWITKLRGAFYGYREIIFERLVQRAGWLSQSSTFATLDPSSLRMLSIPDSECVQLVTKLLSEHPGLDCGALCPIRPFYGYSGDDLPQKLAASELTDAENIARQDILAPLLGGNEPAGCLTTIDHKVFLIDGEQMFATLPSDVTQTCWWRRQDGTPSLDGQRLTYQVCAKIGSFDDNALDGFLMKPPELKLRLRWPLRPIVFAARDYGRAFARSYERAVAPPYSNVR